MGGWALAAVFVAAFLVGYAAPFLSPVHFWWTNLVAVALPGLSVAVGGLAAGLCVWGAWRGRWGRGAVGAALLVLLAVRFGPRLAAWGPAPPPAESLRLMTFNVPPTFAGGGPDGTPLATLVRREAPHILALQESRVTTDRTGRGPVRRRSGSLEGVLAGSSGYGLARRHPAATTIQQPVLGRLPLDSMSVHPLPPDGETSTRSRYTRTTFSWQGRPVVLYNLHLHSVGRARPWTLMPEEWTSPTRWATFLRTYREGALRRAQQARLLRRRLDRETRPVLVVGDFNSTPHQWAYRHLAQGLQSSVTRRLPEWGGTFPARRPLVQIDHVLAGPAWQVTAARIPGTAAQLSDHRPVVAHLRWKPR
jgi:endonuclease/exonuclease/phosphatase family metal-dependent hydrolase